MELSTFFFSGYCIHNIDFVLRSSYRYKSTGNVSVKSDVYSFGIVLLELVSSRPAVMEFTNTTALVLLSKLVKDTLDEDRGDIRAIVDPKLHGDCDMNSAKVVVETALACIRRNPSKRPTMSVIAWILKECLERSTEKLKLDLVSLLGPPEEETGSHPDPPEKETGSHPDPPEEEIGSHPDPFEEGCEDGIEYSE